MSLSLIQHFIDVQITLVTSFAPRTGFGVPLFIGETVLDPVVRVGQYTSMEEVDAVFNTTDPEYLAAQAFFTQGGNAKKMLIGYKASGETYTQALAAIRALRDDFYCIAIQSVDVAIQTAFAATIAGFAGAKTVFYRTADANVLNAGNSTDIASVLKAVNNDYGHVTYHYDVYSASNTDGVFPEMGLIGRVITVPENATLAAGSIAWHNQPIKGIASSFNPAGGKMRFTETERQTLVTKNCDAFETDGNAVRVLVGKMAGGEWGDVIHGVEWLKTRLSEDLYILLTTKADAFEKVGFDTAGITLVESVITARLKQAVGTKFIDADFKVTTPKVSDTQATDRANRVLKDVTFTARLIGAVRNVELRGVVTV
jgi:hypothetical protein